MTQRQLVRAALSCLALGLLLGGLAAWKFGLPEAPREMRYTPGHVRSRGGHDARYFAGWEVGGVRFRPRRRSQPGPLCAAASGRRPGAADVDRGERIGSIFLQ